MANVFCLENIVVLFVFVGFCRHLLLLLLLVMRLLYNSTRLKHPLREQKALSQNKTEEVEKKTREVNTPKGTRTQKKNPIQTQTVTESESNIKYKLRLYKSDQLFWNSSKSKNCSNNSNIQTSDERNKRKSRTHQNQTISPMTTIMMMTMLLMMIKTSKSHIHKIAMKFRIKSILGDKRGFCNMRAHFCLVFGLS